ncbi:MAG: FAD-dependent oxidoreductase, partial [Planctomycetales bacterium]
QGGSDFNAEVGPFYTPISNYVLGNLIGVSDDESQRHINRAKQLSLSLLYWLQTEAPRPDGGTGFPGLRLRPDIMGTEDGLAKTPYIRESRRIRAEFTILEEHVGRDNRAMVAGQNPTTVRAAEFKDSVGVGSYGIDLHPSSSGDNYIDFASLPFQVPLGALLPVRVSNLIPVCKNIGTTHITSGCYRLHPVEWGIGEAAGYLASFAITENLTPRAIRNTAKRLESFQNFIRKQGVETEWRLG